MDIVFSVCLGSLILRTKNIHCICVCLGSHACMDIVFSVCLGSLAVRTKNILCVCVSDWVRLSRFMHIQMEYRSAICFSIGTNGTNRQVVNRRPSVVNIFSLQMVYQSTNNFSMLVWTPLESICTNGTNRQGYFDEW